MEAVAGEVIVETLNPPASSEEEEEEAQQGGSEGTPEQSSGKVSLLINLTCFASLIICHCLLTFSVLGHIFYHLHPVIKRSILGKALFSHRHCFLKALVEDTHVCF